MHWKEQLKENIVKIDELIHLLQLDQENQQRLYKKTLFPLNIPRRIANKIKKNDLNDPLFRQFVPLKEEQIESPNFSSAPCQDHTFLIGKKLLKKYAHRSLLVTTKACAMNCRFCFRQNFPYQVEVKGFNEEITIIKKDPTIREVILSGGDPFSLDDETLFSLLHELNAISHIDIIRIHTRFILGIPERISSDFLERLKNIVKPIVLVLHVNHPSELDELVLEKIALLKRLGITLMSQSVLLKGVNDSIEILTKLMWTLGKGGILPYYLHQLDKVKGTTHFEVSKEQGITLYQELKSLLPGYLVPKYVEEIPNAPSKSEIFISQ